MNKVISSSIASVNVKDKCKHRWKILCACEDCGITIAETDVDFLA